MMQVTGEEGISLADYVVLQKAQLVDTTYLQQDAYDPVDVSTEPERQVETFLFLKRLTDYHYSFTDRHQARDLFLRLAGLLKNMNYAPADSREYQENREKIEKLVEPYIVP